MGNSESHDAAPLMTFARKGECCPDSSVALSNDALHVSPVFVKLDSLCMNPKR
jgi:hypothetical protein